MERIKEIKISFSEENRCPRVEINGEKLSSITDLMVKYNSDNAIDNPFDNGFRVEYISEENGRYCKQTIGRSFCVDKQHASRLVLASNRK